MRCSPTRAITNLASSLWTRSTPSEAGDSPKVPPLTEKSKGEPGNSGRQIRALDSFLQPLRLMSPRLIFRTLMELLNQMDGFDTLGKVKMIMATNRPDTLDPALLRPGRLDRKIEIPLPNEQSRMEILKIHANPIAKHGDIDWEAG